MVGQIQIKLPPCFQILASTLSGLLKTPLNGIRPNPLLISQFDAKKQLQILDPYQKTLQHIPDCISKFSS